MTTFADMLFQLGGAPVGAFPMIPPGGKWFFVDGVLGSDSNGGTWDAPLKTITAAYALTTNNKHDVVALIGKATATLETAAIAWSNSYTHLLGLTAPVHTGNRARIVCNATDLSPFVTFSGNGCIVGNVRLWQGQDDVHSLILASVTGQRNYFWNVDFAGGGHATQAIDGGASCYLNGGSENVFERCTFGVDSVVAGTGMMNLLFDAAAARNTFDDCLFQIYAGHTGAGHVEVVDNVGLDRWNLFRRCMFINSCRSYALASAFVIPAAMTSVTNFLLLQDCFSVGATDWDASNRGVMYLSNGAATAGGTAGLFQASNAT